MSHRYRVGQTLDLRSAKNLGNRPNGTCEVLACLPHDAGPMMYRVKSHEESYQRVVEEADLSPSSGVKSAIEKGEAFFNIAVVKR